ncbi:hypothetical protein [Paraburkholderia phenoliruptrix]|uniref:hypothetical protein n=1 Tax=Paraburkholderia phenoliruptrix TaxID=252970 RepID=UPI001CB7A3F7|nr:hypothetical protein [Paraburkholderia phenoliruptrix]
MDAIPRDAALASALTDEEALLLARETACGVDGNALSIFIATSDIFKAFGAKPVTGSIDRHLLKLDAL